ncbi:hypothetical protein [Mycolicibacterium sp.]|uniref:hypothetical protein n=1 Tax=Mycolicibacterium sp. TaxID=2320850 RepID=UPI00355FBC6A
MELTVKVYLNEGANPFSPYDPAKARLHEAATFDTTAEPSGDGVKAVLSAVFEQLNIDYPTEVWAQRYRADRHRSLSVGDVVTVGETAWAIAPIGWDRISTADLSAGITNAAA